MDTTSIVVLLVCFVALIGCAAGYFVGYEVRGLHMALEDQEQAKARIVSTLERRKM